MNWIHENKFLTGFIAVMVVGIAILGYLGSSAYSGFSEVSEKYDREAAELKRLQNLAPYPSEENLEKLRAQKDSLTTAISGVAQQLNEFEIPEEPLKPTEFQDRLRAAVSAVVEKAAKNEVKLPDKFYLSYDEFQTALPRDDAAAAALGRELKAIDLVVNQLVESKPEAITGVKRLTAPDAAPTPKPAAGPAAKAAPSAPKFVTKRAFDLSFVIEQGRFRRFLNAVTSEKQPFLVLRNIRIKNQADKGPSRLEAGVDPGTAGDPSGAGAAPKPASLKFILGTEKLEVAVRLEILDFNPPPATASK